VRRVSFFTPSNGLTAETTSRALDLVGVAREPSDLGQLSPLELQLVYDWAMRVHLAAADNRVQERPRPTVLDRLVPIGPVVVDGSPS